MVQPLRHRIDTGAQIDLVSVPVFVIERKRDGSFRYVAINRAYAAATGLDADEIAGKTPHDVFSASAARALVRQCRRAVDSALPISFRETLALDERLVTFDTTLQRQQTGNRQRVIGTSLGVEQTVDILSDLEFYVAMARSAMVTLSEMTEGVVAARDTARERQATAILSRQALQSMTGIEQSVARIGKRPVRTNSETVRSIRSVILETISGSAEDQPPEQRQKDSRRKSIEPHRQTRERPGSLAFLKSAGGADAVACGPDGKPA